MSKLFPTQEIGSLKKPADMLKKVKDPNVSDEEKIKVRNDAALLNIKTLEDILFIANSFGTYSKSKLLLT